MASPALIVTASVPPLITFWLPRTEICGPPFGRGAVPDRCVPETSAAEAEAAMSLDAQGSDRRRREPGLPGDSLLQAIANDSAVMARHPPITRGTMRGVSL